MLRAATLDGESWVARFGQLVEKRPGDQHGILYDTMVNTMRGEIPPGVEFICAKVTDIATSKMQPDRHALDRRGDHGAAC